MKAYHHANSLAPLWAQIILGENKATSMDEHLKVLFLIGVGGVSSNNPKTTRSSWAKELLIACGCPSHNAAA